MLKHSIECDTTWALMDSYDLDESATPAMKVAAVEAMRAFVSARCPVCDDPMAIFGPPVTPRHRQADQTSHDDKLNRLVAESVKRDEEFIYTQLRKENR